MTVDGRVNNVSPPLLRTLAANPQGRPVTAETARNARTEILRDGRVSPDEKDLLDEMLANRTQITVNGGESDFPPTTLRFGALQPGARAELAQTRAAANAAPASWGNVTIAERQNNIRALQASAQRMQRQGVTGPEIWSRLTSQAVDAYANKNIPAARQSDFVMQDLGVAILGPTAVQRLSQYQGLPLTNNGGPMVQSFQRDFATLGLPAVNAGPEAWSAAGWAGPGLDSSNGSAFRPQINDKSNNQVFHTFFYQYMGYATDSGLSVNGGSMVHELFDPGNSAEDHNASFVGGVIGLAMRRGRDGGQAAEMLQEWPGMTRAAYSRDGGAEIANGTASPMAKKVNEVVGKMLTESNLAWGAQNTAINIAGGVRSIWNWVTSAPSRASDAISR